MVAYEQHGAPASRVAPPAANNRAENAVAQDRHVALVDSNHHLLTATWQIFLIFMCLSKNDDVVGPENNYSPFITLRLGSSSVTDHNFLCTLKSNLIYHSNDIF